MNEKHLEKAEQLDRDDDLASFKSKFHFPVRNGKSCIYLCGNSLGLQPITTQSYIDDELQNWRDHGVEGHFTGDKPWVSYHLNSKKVLSYILGANSDEVVAMNNLTTNLHLALVSFYRPKGRRTKILIERGAFPSDFYAVYSQIRMNGGDPERDLIQLESKNKLECLSEDEIIEAIHTLGDELALVMFPGVQYYTGQLFNLKAISATAHQVGAYAGFDLAHTAGNVPLNLHEDQVDFAVWCTYKYLNSGPGGVGGLFIHENHGKNKEMVRLSGWWGHDAKARFKMDNQINPIPTVDGWQLSNVNIISHASHLASLELFEQADIHKLRNKSLLLTGLMEECINSSEILKDHGKIITPSDPNQRGCQLSLYLLNHGKSVFEYLVKNGVILDWREPNVIRVAPVPLYNSFVEVVEFVSILENAIKNER